MDEGSGPTRRAGSGYELLDAGDGRRLERFGDRILDRPAPGAGTPRRAPARWRDVDLRFDVDRGWSGRALPAEPWTVTLAGLEMELRPTSSGGVGLYPEHAANLDWLEAAVRGRSRDVAAPRVLNLFAHTGLATLAAARAGALVAHVDAARFSVEWARRNAARNGLADAPVRWLVDDALAFTEREARRGRRYEGLVLDPPSSGHAGSGRGGASRWTLRDDLPDLLAAAFRVASDGAFVLLTAHSTGLDGVDLADLVAGAFHAARDAVGVAPLTVSATSGASLAMGWAVRLGANAAP